MMMGDDVCLLSLSNMFELEIEVLLTAVKLEISVLGFRIGSMNHFATSFSFAGRKLPLLTFQIYRYVQLET
jgi:hypothetical protein